VNVQTLFDQKVGIQKHTVAADERTAAGAGGTIAFALAVAPPDLTKLIVRLGDTVVEAARYSFNGASFTYSADADLPAAGTVFTFIHDNTLYQALTSLMDKAKAGGSDRTETASFLDLVEQFHGWTQALHDAALGEVETRLALLEAHVAALQTAHNGHTHTATDTQPDSSTLTRTTSGPSTAAVF
jgi:ABC-type cobalt transport system substrate-binding protein